MAFAVNWTTSIVKDNNSCLTEFKHKYVFEEGDDAIEFACLISKAKVGGNNIGKPITITLVE